MAGDTYGFPGGNRVREFGGKNVLAPKFIIVTAMYVNKVLLLLSYTAAR